MISTVQAHYGATDIVGRILAAIPWQRDSAVALTAPDVFPFDQLHGRELLATREHAARLDPPREAHILDIGAGIGGPARYFASTFGCRVTGIDLTPDFVAAANEISGLCDLNNLLTFIKADAASVPFADGTFDHAYSFYVGMNIQEKLTVLKECFRVLKPGGRMLWTEVTESNGNPHYPLPWSRTVEGSHIPTRETLVDLFAAAGFEILAAEDETGVHLELARQMKQSGRAPTPGQHQANEVVLGPDFVDRRMNYIKSLSEGLVASTLIDARKPT